MEILLLGLLLFLGVHSLHIVAPDTRKSFVAKMGAGAWKGVFSLVSLAGFVLICFGYAAARREMSMLWIPPTGMRHAAGLLMLIALVLLVATYVPRNSIKARLHHPMLLATKVWAFAHLLANGMAADVLLFGSFLVWAIVAFAVARRRDRAAGTVYAAGTSRATLVTGLLGVALWAVLAFGLHAMLFGVSPFG